MAKKKYKVMFKGLEVSSSNIDDFLEFQKLLHKAAQFERQAGHLKNHSDYEMMAASIITVIGEQIK